MHTHQHTQRTHLTCGHNACSAHTSRAQVHALAYTARISHLRTHACSAHTGRAQVHAIPWELRPPYRAPRNRHACTGAPRVSAGCLVATPVHAAESWTQQRHMHAAESYGHNSATCMLLSHGHCWVMDTTAPQG